MKLIVVLSLFFSLSLYAAPFDTLSFLQTYAHNHTEMVMPDNGDWLNPEFDSLMNTGLRHWWNRALIYVGLSKEASMDDFQALLKKVIDQRKYTIDSRYLAERIEPVAGDQFIIWGDVSGAFHSLVRDLTYLKQQGIIDNKLIIRKKNYYFVFNGNVMKDGPYALEALMVVLQLMIKNPDQVVYVRGHYEVGARWHNNEIQQQFKIHSAGRSKEDIMGNDALVNSFFNTLPVALFVTQQKENRIEAVVLSGIYDYFRDGITREYLGDIFSVQGKRGFFNDRAVRVSDGHEISIRAFITAENLALNYRNVTGLASAGVVGSMMHWFVFSSPTAKNQSLYGFKRDSFVQLAVTDAIQSWVITVIDKGLAQKDTFKVAASYFVISGLNADLDKKSDEQEVVFGSIMDLTKSGRALGKSVREGLLYAFQQAAINHEIPGVIPQLRAVNDEYVPFKARRAVEDLLKSGVDMMIGSQGSPSLEAYLDLVKEGKILALFPFTGSPLFRNQDLKNIIHYRASYIQEGQGLIHFAIHNLKAHKIAIIYENDAFGRGPLDGAQQALKAAGMDHKAIAFDRGASDLKQQIQELKDYNPDTILFSTNSLGVRAFIRDAGVQYFGGKKLLGLSVYEHSFEQYLKNKGLNFVMSRVVPDSTTSQLEIAQEYRKLMDQHNVPYGQISFESYINAAILFEILRLIKGPITKEKIIEVAEGLKNYPFKGLTLDFNPETRSLADTFWIDSGSGPWIAHKTMALEQEDPPAERRNGGESI